MPEYKSSQLLLIPIQASPNAALASSGIRPLRRERGRSGRVPLSLLSSAIAAVNHGRPVSQLSARTGPRLQCSKIARYARDLVRGRIIHDDEVASVVHFASASAMPKRANISTAVPSALSFASEASSFFRMASSIFRAPRAVRTIHDGL